MSASINRVTIIGNLTRDPELKATAGGTAICTMRVAVNDRVKDAASGEWQDRPNYFNVTVFGAQAERYAEWLSKGRQVAVDGKLRWSEWQDKDGNKLEAVEIIADTVQMLGPRGGGTDTGTQRGNAAGGRTGGNADDFTAQAQAAFAKAGMDTFAEPADLSDVEDDGIPF